MRTLNTNSFAALVEAGFESLFLLQAAAMITKDIDFNIR